LTRNQIIEVARSWLGTKWVHQGRSRAGVDCVGLLIAVGDALGVHYEDKLGYGRHALSHDFMHHLHRFVVRAPFDAYRPGLIGVFAEKVFPCHVGIFAEKQGHLTLISSRADRRAVVEEYYTDNDRILRLVEVLALPGMED
jgi:hypothetical protein